ncbi:acidic leucine-rich nuclear phosphoprotein 32 family member A-like [Neltuma alba]|uniref:acidic leucine-rich nuclear phosphoprotein 32 family member A-like n=1 Tax=Neltuma alba TaxID=207710 RepID=UPI0010A2FF8A|nr:acidic leucine-rich nuclear phosphoprotein 32 family member A-like [Prosopis alba]
METPSSTRRVTRSQASAALTNNSNGISLINNIPVSRKTEDSEKALTKSRQRNGKQQDRSVLIDITNDSPIVGLAGGNLKTPSSSIVKQKVKNTPGSGEALLRGQVKTLLQRVEEEAVLSKISLESRPFLQLVNSPSGVVAPTPANTPQISNLSGEASVTPQAIEEHSVSQVVNQGSPDSDKNQITRSLLMDFSDKSEISDLSECSSELAYQEVVGGGKDKPAAEDDDASIWSIQVNASTHDEDEEEVAEEEEEDEEYYDEDEEYDDGGLVDELCEGLNKISVNERAVPKFEGKHTRFVYNSDDELVGEEEEEKENEEASPSVLHLKGLPTPKGKHLRFPEEEAEPEDKADMAL